jgi:anti-anti-sigma factor
MSVTTQSSNDGKELTIAIKGRFDFALQKDFRSSYENVAASNYVVDLRNTEYMDSSALGMLLMMREHAGGNSAKITLKNCSQDIKTILSVANFHSLFNIA